MAIPTDKTISGVYYEGTNIPTIGPNAIVERLDNTLDSFSYDGTATKVPRDFMRDCKSITSVTMNGVTEIQEYAFAGCDLLESISFNSATTIGNYAFCYNPKLELFHLPSATTIGGYILYVTAASAPKNDVIVVLPLATTLAADAFRGSKISKIDLGGGVSALPNRCFYATNSNHKCDVLILRKTDAVVTYGTNSISFSAYNRGTTVYVPSALKSIYEQETNWSAWLALYSGNSFAEIEGSEYEYYYADGTPIPQSN